MIAWKSRSNSAPPALSGAQHRGAEGVKQRLLVAARQPVGVGAKRGRLGQRLQAREGRQGRVGGHVVEVGDAAAADGFERQQAEHAGAGGDLAGAGQAGGADRAGQVEGD